MSRASAKSESVMKILKLVMLKTPLTTLNALLAAFASLDARGLYGAMSLAGRDDVRKLLASLQVTTIVSPEWLPLDTWVG